MVHLKDVLASFKGKIVVTKEMSIDEIFNSQEMGLIVFQYQYPPLVGMLVRLRLSPSMLPKTLIPDFRTWVTTVPR